MSVVRRGYEALATGDVEGFLSLLDPQIEWTHPEGLPYSGTHRGMAGMQEVLRLWGATYEEMQVIPEEYLEVGDYVVVLARYHGRGRGSGIEIQQEGAHVFKLRDGKVVRLEIFASRDKALESVAADRISSGGPCSRRNRNVADRW